MRYGKYSTRLRRQPNVIPTLARRVVYSMCIHPLNTRSENLPVSKDLTSHIDVYISHLIHLGRISPFFLAAVLVLMKIYVIEEVLFFSVVLHSYHHCIYPNPTQQVKERVQDIHLNHNKLSQKRLDGSLQWQCVRRLEL